MWGICEVEADSLEGAKVKALSWETDLPEGVFRNAKIDEGEIEVYNKNTVSLPDEQKKKEIQQENSC